MKHSDEIRVDAPVILRTAEFEALLIDNRAHGEHYSGYNGLMSLTPLPDPAARAVEKQ